MGLAPTTSRLTWCSPSRIIGSDPGESELAGAVSFPCDVLLPARADPATPSESRRRNSLREVPFECIPAS